MNALTEKFREVSLSIIPIIVSILLLHFFVVSIESEIIYRFIIGSVLIMIGMPLFLRGVDISIEKIGEDMSQALIQTNKMKIVMIGSFLFGFIISVAEPDLHILAQQVSAVTNNAIPQMTLVIVVSLGIGLMIALGMYRILKSVPLNRFIAVVYGIIFILALFNSGDFLAISFDASGSTTGSITVPFMLALAGGASAITRSGLEEDTDSFGLLGIASTGAILGILVMGIVSPDSNLSGEIPVDTIQATGVWGAFIEQLPITTRDSLLSLIPVLILFYILNAVSLKKSKRQMIRINIGLVYTIIGLILFLTGVNAGFMDASRSVGFLLSETKGNLWVIVVGIIFGVLTIPAEPSVHVLTNQIEEETAGAIKARTVMLSLALGVGLAVGLSILRIIIPSLQLWHILLPGLIIAIVLSFMVPDIFVGIAFDSGGVAAGTMTATFILPFAQGVAESNPSANVLTDGFGVIALVAMTPLVTVQALGLLYRLRTKNDARLGKEDIYD
ncbi:DUF1538 domain-containing protein [Jeotgalibaca sp. A127]|uniref:DUF1538 domain-containing protein n=1 Tax=Jeotgalibaca sp. A127 TaxID=3457324 RepID=UPI003FD5D699